MEPQSGKVAADVRGKTSESRVPSLIKKIFRLRAEKKIAQPTPREIEKRTGWERRSGSGDRRVSSVDRRLRTGFCIEYFRRTGAGKFDLLVLSHKTRQELFGALVTEASRYQFLDRSNGSILQPAAIIEEALEANWATWCHRPDSLNRAVLVLEEIAEYLMTKYKVNKVDRREQQRPQIMPATG
jgi:hypothetical protein